MFNVHFADGGFNRYIHVSSVGFKAFYSFIIDAHTPLCVLIPSSLQLLKFETAEKKKGEQKKPARIHFHTVLIY